MEWLIGCSGFSYKDWKGEFYPEKLAQSKWFEYYAQQFNTLEINTTFYRFPRAEHLKRWYEKSPADFLFAVKVPRFITHYKKFTECESLANDFYNAISEGLKDKLGTVLYQLPAQIKYDEVILDKILAVVDTSFKNVIEFRDVSWWNKKVYDTLEQHNITFCSINHPSLPIDVVINNELVYYRFHGSPQLYYSQYKTAEVIAVADTILKDKNTKQAFVYFNNTATMAALNNANELKAYLNK